MDSFKANMTHAEASLQVYSFLIPHFSFLISQSYTLPSAPHIIFSRRVEK